VYNAGGVAAPAAAAASSKPAAANPVILNSFIGLLSSLADRKF
jgi:hypothetical protein